MNRGISSLFLAAVASAALVTGCGGSTNSPSSTSTSNSTNSAASSSSTTSAAKKSTSTTHTTSTTPSTAGALGGATVAAYCEAALASAKTLTSSQKGEFESFCASLTHDNATQIKAAAKTLCGKIMSIVPAAERPLAAAECAKL
jgi:hypothetical protein